jgi:hypothetical protein
MFLHVGSMSHLVFVPPCRLLLERQLPVIFERAFTTSTWPFASDVFVFSLEMVRWSSSRHVARLKVCLRCQSVAKCQ